MRPIPIYRIQHGFYSKHFLKSELKDLEEIGDLQEEIQMMRVVTRRVLEAARECKDVGELSNLLNTLGLAATRVGGLMKVKKFFGGDTNSAIEEIHESISGWMKEFGWGR